MLKILNDSEFKYDGSVMSVSLENCSATSKKWSQIEKSTDIKNHPAKPLITHKKKIDRKNDEQMRHRKYVIKYMGISRYLANTNELCGSRQIGAVVVQSGGRTTSNLLNGFSSIVGTGINGPPTGVPHCDTRDHYKNIVIPDPHVRSLNKFKGCTTPHEYLERMIEIKDSCPDPVKKRCPRKLLEYNRPNEMSHLCSCQHAEQNAIHNCSIDIKNSQSEVSMFCWCGVPCKNCTIAIIQNNISSVYCLNREIYSDESLWLFNRARTIVYVLDEAELERELNKNVKK